MRDVEQIFSDMMAHQVKGLMVHSQLADYYRFLGLDKYAECHECHYKEESHCWRKMSKYYVEHFNKLVKEQRIDDPEVIPSDWFSVTRQDVDVQTKRRAVEKGLKEWVDWEKETKKLYEEAFGELLALGEGAAAMRVKKCLCDVDNELSNAEKWLLNKKTIDYDMAYIVDEQRK